LSALGALNLEQIDGVVCKFDVNRKQKFHSNETVAIKLQDVWHSVQRLPLSFIAFCFACVMHYVDHDVIWQKHADHSPLFFVGRGFTLPRDTR